MLIVTWFLAFVGSYHAVKFLAAVFDGAIGAPFGTLVATATGASVVLLIAFAGVRLHLRNPHLPVAFAFGGLIFMWLPLGAVVVHAFGSVVAEEWASVALIFGLFAVWGLISDALMRATLGRAAVDAHWNYVMRVYSTFRKD